MVFGFSSPGFKFFKVRDRCVCFLCMPRHLEESLVCWSLAKYHWVDDVPNWGAANIFYEGPDHKYFWFSRNGSLCPIHLALLLLCKCSHRLCVNE